MGCDCRPKYEINYQSQHMSFRDVGVASAGTTPDAMNYDIQESFLTVIHFFSTARVREERHLKMVAGLISCWASNYTNKSSTAHDASFVLAYRIFL
ncbi:hypothetical protein RRG08_051964 [Elysia crispata]|uniref:Uncharacterized protein n=1 Tax=Elysia crispata TaxID=231223 RepID=A0AAE0ZCB1_9GAST|nr:hypothetical protein RRG08_051964 [Elysia crispata]